jgi:hypothetical protein
MAFRYTIQEIKKLKKVFSSSVGMSELPDLFFPDYSKFVAQRI